MAALFELGAGRAADALRNGEHTAEALAEALLARCAASPLNAFITLEAERLRAAARAADQRRQRGERLAPLHGVPLALKDNIDTADFPTTGGTPALAAHRPKRNAPIVQRLLDAGAIVLRKTNLQELAYGPTNNNAAFGPARNPYDPTRIPGGSSVGSAAAVAARLAPAALGTDTGVSTRVTAGPMARHVADCVLLDGAITGGPTEVAPAPLKGLRLGVPRGYFWENLDAELAAILEAELARLREAGVVLVEGDVANVAALDAAAGFPIMLYETVIELERYLAEHETGLDFASIMAQVKSPSVKQALASLRGADAVSEAIYREALTKHRPALQETYRRYFRELGVAAMVFPTTPLPAATIGEDDTVMLNGVPVSTLSTFIRNLAPGSAAGIPGLSLPAGMTKAGLPVGMAIDAPEKSDHQLLAIGLALETVLPRLPAPPA